MSNFEGDVLRSAMTTHMDSGVGYGAPVPPPYPPLFPEGAVEIREEVGRRSGKLDIRSRINDQHMKQLERSVHLAIQKIVREEVSTLLKQIIMSMAKNNEASGGQVIAAAEMIKDWERRYHT